MKIVFLLLFLSSFAKAQNKKGQADIAEVLVVGGGVGGTAAAIQSARFGAKTILIEQGQMLGGMLTAAGVACTDGNDKLGSGIWEEFRLALRAHYGKEKLSSGWVSNTNFEPHVADSIFKILAKTEKNLIVYYGYRLNSIKKRDNQVVGAEFISIESSKILTIASKILVDGTEMGDAMAMAGAKYNLGMDDPKETGEKEAREKNNIIQDMTWAAILKDYGEGADKTIAKPAGYDPKLFYCCCTDAPCDGKPWNGGKWKMLEYGKLPKSPGGKHEKYMLNWPPHGNDIYLNFVESSEADREKNYELAKNQTLGFIYFIQTELGLKHIGLAEDELNKGIAWMPYIREGRRLKGKVNFTLNHVKNPYDYDLFKTGISVGDYPVDHHHERYPGKVPQIEFPPIPSYSIPLGSLIPESVKGLVVCEKAISASNLANGTTRLQPVVMLTGQAAGALAANCAKEKIQPEQVSVRRIQEILLNANCYLMPFIDVAKNDPAWNAVQKVGLTGILKGKGIAEHWANKTLFYPDSTISENALGLGLKYFENQFPIEKYTSENKMSITRAWAIILDMQRISRERKVISPVLSPVFPDDWKGIFKTTFGKENEDGNRPITRKEIAVLIENLQHSPFTQEIDLQGKTIQPK